MRALGRAGVRVGAFDAARVFPRTAHGGAHSAGDCPRLATRTSSSTHCYHGPAVEAARTARGARQHDRGAARPEGGDRGRGGAGAAAGGGACGGGGQGAEARAGRAPRRARADLGAGAQRGRRAVVGGRTWFPAVIKPVQSWVPSPGGGRRLSCVIAIDADEARIAAEQATRLGGCVVLQQWVRGSREAVSRDHPGADALAMTPNTPRPS